MTQALCYLAMFIIGGLGGVVLCAVIVATREARNDRHQDAAH